MYIYWYIRYNIPGFINETTNIFSTHACMHDMTEKNQHAIRTIVPPAPHGMDQNVKSTSWEEVYISGRKFSSREGKCMPKPWLHLWRSCKKRPENYSHLAASVRSSHHCMLVNCVRGEPAIKTHPNLGPLHTACSPLLVLWGQVCFR